MANPILLIISLCVGLFIGLSIQTKRQEVAPPIKKTAQEILFDLEVQRLNRLAAVPLEQAISLQREAEGRGFYITLEEAKECVAEETGYPRTFFNEAGEMLVIYREPYKTN